MDDVFWQDSALGSGAEACCQALLKVVETERIRHTISYYRWARRARAAAVLSSARALPEPTLL